MAPAANWASTHAWTHRIRLAAPAMSTAPTSTCPLQLACAIICHGQLKSLNGGGYQAGDGCRRGPPTEPRRSIGQQGSRLRGAWGPVPRQLARHGQAGPGAPASPPRSGTGTAPARRPGRAAGPAGCRLRGKARRPRCTRAGRRGSDSRPRWCAPDRAADNIDRTAASPSPGRQGHGARPLPRAALLACPLPPAALLAWRLVAPRWLSSNGHATVRLHHLRFAAPRAS